MRDAPCKGHLRLFEPYRNPGESQALRGLRLSLAVKSCEVCPYQEQCRSIAEEQSCVRGLWGAKIYTSLKNERNP